MLSRDLHSTMLLLYLGQAFHDCEGWDIYIPLCFYFIGEKGYGKQRYQSFTFHYASTLSPTCLILNPFFLNLHSTMLLLYRDPESNRPGGYPFTFHYASTLSLSSHLIYRDISKFTFHYASTLSAVICACFPKRLIIYIPLCFYFIYQDETDSANEKQFTFHYASTLSERRE